MSARTSVLSFAKSSARFWSGTTITLILLLILGFGLRVMRLEVQSIWVDEGFSVDFASRTASDMTAMWKARGGFGAIDNPNAQRASNDPLAIAVDIHPPLYYLILHEWMPQAGKGEFSVRFPSVMAGVLLVLVLFKLGQALSGPPVGLVAAAIGTVAPYYIGYSQEARMYAPVALFSAFSLYFCWLVIRDASGHRRPGGEGQGSSDRSTTPARPPLVWPWLGLVVTSSLALYTHYSAVLVIAAENILVGTLALWWLLRQRKQLFQRLALPWLVSQAVELLLFLPWLRTSIGQVAKYNENLWTPNWRVELDETFRAFDVGLWVPAHNAQRSLWVCTGLLVLGLAAAVSWGYLNHRRQLSSNHTRAQQRALAFGTAVLAVETGLALAIFQIRPEFHPRYLMVLATPYYLLWGVALMALARLARPAAVLAAAGLLALAVYGLYGYQFDPNFAKDDTRTLAQYLTSHTTADDVIFLDAPEPLGYYYHGPAEQFYIPGNEQTAAAMMTRLAAGKRHIVYVQWFLSTSDPEQLLPFLLQRYGKLVDDHTFRGYREREYAIPPHTTFNFGQLRSVQPIDFGGIFQLEAASYGPSIDGEQRLANDLLKPEAFSGQQLMLGLRWKLLKPVTKDYKVTAYLTDEEDHLAGQVDLTMYRGQATTRRWVVGDEATNYYVMQTVGGLMPGSYQLHLAVYPDGGVERLSVLDAAGAPQGGNVILGKVQILPPTGPVDLASLGIPHRIDQPAAAGIQLAGYGLPKTELLQGDSLPLSLFWQITAAPAANLPTAIALKPQGQTNGRTAGWTWSGQPSFPTSQWKSGWAFRDWYQPTLPVDLSPGSYQVMAGLGQPSIPLGDIQVQARQRSFVLPHPQQEISARLGLHIELLGYDLDKPEYQPGDTVHLTLYWRATGSSSTSYSVFAHVLDAGRHVVAQRDAIPVQGTLPTTAWAPGQIITDEYELPLERSLASGTYQLETGMYRAETGERLPATSKDVKVIDNGILLGPLVVR